MTNIDNAVYVTMKVKSIDQDKKWKIQSEWKGD